MCRSVSWLALWFASLMLTLPGNVVSSCTLSALVPYHMQLTQQKGFWSSLQEQHSIQGSIACVCSKDGNDYHRRRKQDCVRHSLQSGPFSKPSCFLLQNHILFCSSSGAVWCWSWICERRGGGGGVKVSNVYKHRRNVSKIWPNPNMIFVIFFLKARHLTCKHKARVLAWQGVPSTWSPK